MSPKADLLEQEPGYAGILDGGMRVVIIMILLAIAEVISVVSVLLF